MLSLKVIISKILCTPFIGAIIAWVYNNEIPFQGTLIYTAHAQVSNRIKAMLFWKMYESSEMRFVQKYVTDKYDVVELGSSIGAVSIQLANKIKPKKLLAIEANSQLCELLNINLKNNSVGNAKIINAAYASTVNKVWFESGVENIMGKIATQINGKEGFWIETISLTSIISQYQLLEYALVCDIEGAEIDMLLNEKEALMKCKLLIIETHETSYNGGVYTSNQMKELLLDMEFELVDQYGVNLVFRRT